MSIKGVINNIEEKGIQETYKIHLCRKYKLVTSERFSQEKKGRQKAEKHLNDNMNVMLSILPDLIINGNQTNVIAPVMLGLLQNDEAKKKVSRTKKLLSATIIKGIMEANDFAEENIESIEKIVEQIQTSECSDEILLSLDNEMISLENSKYKNLVKQFFVKEIIPEIYGRYSDQPVENKVILMESGNSPSPSAKHLGRELKKQGKYKVVYTGLKTRQVSTTEFYLNAVLLIKDLATAKALCLSTANDLLSCFDVRTETRVIQLWHGVGAFKHVGRSNIDNPHFGKDRRSWDEYDSYRNYTCVTTAAEGQKWIFEEAMGLTPEQILPIGISRTDIFFDTAEKEKAQNKLYEAFPQIRGKKLVLYAPTFRGEVAKALAPDQLDVLKMKEGISDEYVLLIKHHGLSKNIPPIPEGLENTFAFDMNSNKVLDIEQLLLISDILITDYSSVAFEFAITERPIAFFTYDLEDYIEKRGLYFDFYNEAPGPVCKSTDELVDYINNINDSFDRDKMMAFKEKYVSACDGHATERTIALIDGDNPENSKD